MSTCLFLCLILLYWPFANLSLFILIFYSGIGPKFKYVTLRYLPSRHIVIPPFLGPSRKTFVEGFKKSLHVMDFEKSLCMMGFEKSLRMMVWGKVFVWCAHVWGNYLGDCPSYKAFRNLLHTIR